MSKDAFYFSHDSNAHKDPKILKLRAKHGWAGYGIFWAIIETLREQEGYKWKASDKHLLSFCISNGEELVNEVIDTCLEVGLLVIDEDGYIHSESLTRRMKKREEIIEKRRQAGKKGGSSKSKANAKQKESKESKEKESKEKKINYSEYVTLTQSEYEKLVEKLGEEKTKDYIERLNDYKASTGKKYKSDYHTILNWVRRDKDKAVEKPKVEFDHQDFIRRKTRWIENGGDPDEYDFDAYRRELASGS